MAGRRPASLKGLPRPTIQAVPASSSLGRVEKVRLAAWLAAGDPEPWVVETSGSTGVPKRVLLSRTAVLASVRASARRLGGSGQWLLALPASYVAGVQVVCRSLVAGHEPVLLDDHDSFASAAAAMGLGRHLRVARPDPAAPVARDRHGVAARLPHGAARGRSDRPVAAPACRGRGHPGGRDLRVRRDRRRLHLRRLPPRRGRGRARPRRPDPDRRARPSSTGTTATPRSPPRCSSTAGSTPPTRAGSTTTVGCRCSAGSTT